MLKKVDDFKWEPGVLFMHQNYDTPGTIISVPGNFALLYDKSWFEDKSVNIKVVEGIDKSTCVIPGVFNHPVIGNYSHNEISGGAQAVILLREVPGTVVGLATMGENCMPYLYDVTVEREVHVFFEGYLPKFHENQIVYDVDSSVLFDNEGAWEWRKQYAKVRGVGDYET